MRSVKVIQTEINPNVKPTSKSISLRLLESILDGLRQLAHERDIPHQSLIKHILCACIDQAYNKVNKE
jgi:predicted DNA binding CopG/RHH family protein